MCACVYVWETKHPCIFEFINIYSKDVRLNRQFSIYMQSILSFQVNIDFLLLLLFISTWLVAVCKEWKSLSGCESAVDVMTFWAWNGSWFFKDLSFLRKKQNCSWNLTNHKEWLMAQLFISKSFCWSLQNFSCRKTIKNYRHGRDPSVASDAQVRKQKAEKFSITLQRFPYYKLFALLHRIIDASSFISLASRTLRIWIVHNILMAMILPSSSMYFLFEMIKLCFQPCLPSATSVNFKEEDWEIGKSTMR